MDTENCLRMKEEIRRGMLRRRDNLSAEEIAGKSARITERILTSDIYRDAESVFVYIECRSEVQMLPLIGKMLDDGKKVAVPITLSKKEGMYFSQIEQGDTDHLTEARFGLKEPENKHPVEPDAGTLFLIPGSAYDLSGNRLGYGAGYYDRYLENRDYMCLVGICFDFQIVEEIVPENTDIPMDFVVTERRWI
ncbi:MAG: 5-formyltetrahydrofolate cyclo-ligase [Methanosarcinaceae archaeon]|nr:5-formyltetrahydrofolate cyclo-ligase [Methanosarcinaceae archaeon]